MLNEFVTKRLLGSLWDNKKFPQFQSLKPLSLLDKNLNNPNYEYLYLLLSNHFVEKFNEGCYLCKCNIVYSA